jgi:hypothetical protein
VDGARSDHDCDPSGRPEAKGSPYAAVPVGEDPMIQCALESILSRLKDDASPCRVRMRGRV